MFKWVALAGVMAAIVGAGVIVAVAVSHRGATPADRSTRKPGRPAGTHSIGGASSVQDNPYSATVPAGIFDADETAFVKTCLQGHEGDIQGCDCYYHELRGEGYPASTLAVASQDLASEFHADFGRALADCLSK